MKEKRRMGAFTLIELMIVVVLISAIALVAVPMLLRFQQKGKVRPPVLEEVKTKSAVINPADLIKTIRPLVDEAQVRVTLDVRHRLYGMDVYTIYEANLEGTFLFRNVSDEKDPVKIAFPFPDRTSEAMNVSLLFAKEGSQEWSEPAGVRYDKEGITWIGNMAKGATVRAKVTYRAAGQNRFAFSLPGDGLARKVDFVLLSPNVSADYVTKESLRPTKVGKGELHWHYDNVVASSPIVVDLPGGTSPIGRVMLLCKLVSLAVLLFGAGFWYLSEEYKPGQLDDFEWGHFLLLATTYSLFFVIFAVLSYNDASRPALHMLVAALLSLPLLMLHVTRFVSRSFALSRVLPLAIFTLGLVINGVYGGPYRDYVFIGAAVFTMAYVTVTFQKWLAGLTAHEKAQQKRRFFRDRVNKAKAALDGFHQVVKTFTPVWADCRDALDVSRDDFPKIVISIDEKKKEIEEYIEAVEELQNAFDELSKENKDNHQEETEDFIFRTHRRSNQLTEAINSLRLLTSLLLEERRKAAHFKECKEKELNEVIRKFERACRAAASFSEEANENLGKKIGTEEGRKLLEKRIKELEELTSRLPEVKDKKVAKLRLERMLRQVNEHIELLKMTNEELAVREESADLTVVHCLVCGHGAPPSDHCPACGAKHPSKMVCSRCHTMWRHPLHLIAKEHKDRAIHCVNCGNHISG